VPTAASNAAVLAIQLEYTAAIDCELALLASWQVEVPHQGFARIVIIPVAVLVHARPFLIAIPARRTRADRSIERQTSAPSFARLALVGFVREDALAVSARGCSGSAEAPGRVAAAISAWSRGTLLAALEAIERWVRSTSLSTAGTAETRSAVILVTKKKEDRRDRR
jgi:hypothetical protein